MGESLGEADGEFIGKRSLPASGFVPRIEQTASLSGKFLGVPFSSVETVVAELFEGGITQAEGNAVGTTADGDSIFWKIFGRGTPSDNPQKRRASGCILARTTSKKLSRLNCLVILFESETLPDEAPRKFKTKYWEWR